MLKSEILDRLERNVAMTPYRLSDSDHVHELAEHYRNRLIHDLTPAELTELAEQAEDIRKNKIGRMISDMMIQEERVLPEDERAEIVEIVQAETVGLGPLQRMLGDEAITEIMVNWENGSFGHSFANVFIERDGVIEDVSSQIRFYGETHLRHIIDRIVAPLGRRIDESTPYVDARLPDGHRVNAIIPPLSVDGPTLTIRKFRAFPFTINDLIQRETVVPEMIMYLQACVKAKLNILVAGGTGSGKTTTLNILGAAIPHEERIVTIEDAAELRFHNTHPHVVRLEARKENLEGEGAVEIRDLLKNSLRMRPDRIIVGEVRGGEALDMLQAMNTGHEGSMTTVHANSPRDAFSRLESMVMMAEGAQNLPLKPIREQLASAIDIVIHQSRVRGGARKILRISEVQGLRKGEIVLKDIFVFHQTGVSDSGKATGYFSPTGVKPKSLPMLIRRLESGEGDRLEGIFELDYFRKELGAEIMDDASISEIVINAPDEVYVERRGQLTKLEGRVFRDVAHLEGIVGSIGAHMGRRVDEQMPMLDARLPDGSRVNAIMPPLALNPTHKESALPNSPSITIRRFPNPFTMDDLVAWGSLSAEMAQFIQACVIARLNILIVGGTGSGKTTLLNALSSFIPDHQRIVSIEDVAELRLKQSHWVRLETRPADEFDEGQVTIRDLVRNSLRMRPDRIIVGEVRGGEALDMLQAMNTGHSGSMTTIHANSPTQAFSRLQTMLRMASDSGTMSSDEVAAQVSVIDLMVQAQRLADGSRKITTIAEVGDGLIPHPIFEFKQTGISEDGKRTVLGQHEGVSVPASLDALRAHGLELPDSLFSSPTRGLR